MAVCGSIQNHQSGTSLLCLFDTGSTHTFIKRSALPPGVCGKRVPNKTNNTLAGTYTTNLIVELQGIQLPEFTKHRTYDSLPARIIPGACRYDVIFGRDALSLFQLILDFGKNEMTMAHQQV